MTGGGSRGENVTSAPEKMPDKIPQRSLVLIVEDEPIVRFCAAEMLGDSGFDVLEAPAADHALEILESRGDVAVLFTDIEMPGRLDGTALAAIVCERWPWIRVVITSGRVRPMPAELPRPSQFLPKPYMPDQLVSLLTSPAPA